MIELSITELALWAIGGSVVLIALFVWISRWANRNAERRSLRNRLSCRICLCVFEDKSDRHLIRCPHCGADVERGRNHSLG